VVNIRNIQLDAPQFKLPGRAAIYQPVLFDADIWLRDDVEIIAAAPPWGTKAGSEPRNSGYILIDNVTYKSGGVPLRALPTPRLSGRFLIQGPAVAPLSCTLGSVGRRANRVCANVSLRSMSVATTRPTPNVVCTVRGAPELPRDGAWSTPVNCPVVRRRARSIEFPDSDRASRGRRGRSIAGILLIPSTSRYWARTRPRHALRAAAVDRDAENLFCSNTDNNAALPIQTAQAPKLADVAALFNAAGIFPNLGDAFDFSSAKALAVSPDGITYDEVLTINKNEVLLMNFGIIHCSFSTKERPAHRLAPRSRPSQRESALVDCAGSTGDRGEEWSKYAHQPLRHRAGGRAHRGDSQGPERPIRQLPAVLESIFNNLQYVARFLPAARCGVTGRVLTGKADGAECVCAAQAASRNGTDYRCGRGHGLRHRPFAAIDRFRRRSRSSQKPFRWWFRLWPGRLHPGRVNTKGLNVLVQAGLVLLGDRPRIVSAPPR